MSSARFGLMMALHECVLSASPERSCIHLVDDLFLPNLKTLRALPFRALPASSTFHPVPGTNRST